MNIWLATGPKYRVFVKIYHVELILWQKISNWAQLVIISFSSAVRVAKRYSENQNIFVGFLEMLKKIVVKNWILSKIAFISFRGGMLKSKNLKMGTSSEAQFTLTVRTVTVYIAKANVLMGILYILLY